MVTISQVTSPDDIRDVQGLLREYTAWAFTLEADSDKAPTFRGLERELETLPGIYAPPTGGLFLARYDGRPAGCVALKTHETATGELKRLYVRPGFRGANIGAHLVAEVIRAARTLGCRRVILDSHASMTKAHEVYEAAGFRRVAPPGGFPEHLKSRVVFMEMAIE